MKIKIYSHFACHLLLQLPSLAVAVRPLLGASTSKSLLRIRHTSRSPHPDLGHERSSRTYSKLEGSLEDSKGK